MTTYRIINNKHCTGPWPFILINTTAHAVIGVFATREGVEQKIKDIRGRGATK